MCSCGGGRATTPISEQELCGEVKEFGWPADSEVYDTGGNESTVVPRESVGWLVKTDYCPYASGRLAKHIIRRLVRNLAAFNMVEKGMQNLLKVEGKDRSNSGELMYMVHGQPLSNGSVEVASSVVVERLLFVVAKVTWSPYVFDIHWYHFVDECNTTVDALALPCPSKIEIRTSLIAPGRTALGHATSDEFYLKCADTFSNMQISRLVYEVDTTIDRSLKFHKIVGVEDIGQLYDPSMKQPLLHHQTKPPQQFALAKLQTSDPLKPQPKAPARGKPRGKSTPHPKRLRSVGQSSAQPCLADAPDPPDDHAGDGRLFFMYPPHPLH